MHNYPLEQKIVDLFDSYRKEFPVSQRSWDAIASSVGLSRNAVYDIIDSSKDVRRETVILLAFALRMTYTDFAILFNYKGFTLRNALYHEQITKVLFEEQLYNLRLFNMTKRERDESQKNNDLLKEYKDKCSSFINSWLAISGTVDLSRNAVYDVLNPSKDVRRDTVVLLGMALEMSLDEFIKLYNYKGFVFRPGNTRDEITRGFFANKEYDHIKWAKALIDSDEEPPFNYKSAIK